MKERTTNYAVISAIISYSLSLTRFPWLLPFSPGSSLAFISVPVPLVSCASFCDNRLGKGGEKKNTIDAESARVEACELPLFTISASGGVPIFGEEARQAEVEEKREIVLRLQWRCSIRQ